MAMDIRSRLGCRDVLDEILIPNQTAMVLSSATLVLMTALVVRRASQSHSETLRCAWCIRAIEGNEQCYGQTSETKCSAGLGAGTKSM